MCGIAGQVSWSGTVEVPAVSKMLKTLHHRGPDRNGYFFADSHGNRMLRQGDCPDPGGIPFSPSLAFGHARLSILDIAGGVQPLANEDETVWVTFNGEIYNQNELRVRLKACGHRFATSHSDTEVIVHAYEEWGDDCLLMFRGMFAFAIADFRKQRLLLARDRFGVKPLYYRMGGADFVFASELGAVYAALKVRPNIDVQSLSDYLLYQYIPAPATIYCGIAKLMPGEGCVVDLLRHDIRTFAYWNGEEAEPSKTENVNVLTEELLELLRESVRLRMVADVPVGAFLSGGVDSASVVALMREIAPKQELRTFSIGFHEDEYNELDGARFIAERYGTNHQDCLLSADVLNLLPALARSLDEPLADPSLLPTYLVSKMAAEKLKVVLSGDGGDEAFAGYSRYSRAMLFDRMTAPFPHMLRKGVAKALSPIAGHGLIREIIKRLPLSTGEYYSLGICHYEPDELKAIFTKTAQVHISRSKDCIIADSIDSSSRSSLINSLRFVDIRSYLPGAVLAKVDRASMAWSLEVRSPFLDHRLHEFAAKLPPRLLISGGIKKIMLKRAMSHHLPTDFLNRPKKGFGLPLDGWFRSADGQKIINDALNPGSEIAKWLNMAWVERLRDDHARGNKNAGFRLWSLLILEYWLRGQTE